MDTLVQGLQGIGLNEKQAKTYIALIDIGQGTAYEIAKHSGMKRPTTYIILDELFKKGLILKVPHEKNSFL